MQLQISGISQYLYCKLQYFITYVLVLDDVNSYILAGDLVHKNVDKYSIRNKKIKILKFRI